MSSQLRTLLAEFKRRKVYRVAVVYLIVGLSVIEGGQLIFDAVELPRAAWQLVAILTILGFPIALVLAWALELTPEGIRVTPPARPPESAVGDDTLATAPTAEPLEPVPERAPTDDRPCVVVLPFTNLSDDPENQFFSDGVTEEIIARLAGVRGLRVISRTTAMTYKGSHRNLPQIAEELGAQAVVEGTVRRSADRVRVTAQLIAADRDEHLWAEVYDRVLEDVFAVQSEVAENVAHRLDAALTPGERERLHRRPTDSLEAYELFLKGLRVLQPLNPEALREAGQLFREAIALDPGYARAYAGLALTYALMAYHGDVAPNELFPPMRAVANEAISLDSRCGEAHLARAWVASWFEWDWAKAEREMTTALSLDPDDPWALGFSASYLWRRERFAEAEAALRAALRLDPLSHLWNVELAQLHAYTGNAEAGIPILVEELRRHPRSYNAWVCRGICHSWAGDLRAAAGDLDEAISIVGRLPMVVAVRGVVHAVSGETRQTRRILEELRSRANEEYVDPFCFFLLRLLIDGFDAALPYLRRMLDDRSIYVSYLRVTPRLRELRSDPRFYDALRTVWPEDF